MADWTNAAGSEVCAEATGLEDAMGGQRGVTDSCAERSLANRREQVI